MRFNDKYDLYIDEDLVIYYWSKKYDKLMQRPMYNRKGYLYVKTKLGLKRVHRIIYETFVGPIPEGMEIDHINTIRTDNRLDNLRLVTPKENMNNPLTRKHISEAIERYTEFGRKFKETYGITRCQNIKLYQREFMWYRRHNKCRWE